MKWLLLPKAIYLWLNYKLGVWLLKKRNKPMAFLLHPNPLLKRVAEPVDFEKTSMQDRADVVRKMGNALSGASYGGKLGLAAPQIGINLRVCIVQGAVMFNPEWRPSKAPGNTVFEGCYSVPHKVFKVPRAVYGWAKWQSIEGEWREHKLKGLDAIIFQHELDHLNGICCADVGEEVKEEAPSRTPDVITKPTA
jgi:peptide deformylase